ncbi:uncharacterized protein LOC134832040 [Culicoides brevitarsis]|uniref:uncharacterized protein LOC134832040 n=1 Tax=Culicoides brevitarsis TaxID=469753 RepID=UPI00307C618F
MSRIFMNILLYVSFFVICGCAYVKPPSYENYQDPSMLVANKLADNAYEYQDEPVEQPRPNLLQTLMNSRNPEDEPWIRLYKAALQNNWPNNQEWIKSVPYGKRTSNSYMSMCHFKICNMGRRKKF